MHMVRKLCLFLDPKDEAGMVLSCDKSKLPSLYRLKISTVFISCDLASKRDDLVQCVVLLLGIICLYTLVETLPGLSKSSADKLSCFAQFMAYITQKAS